MKYNLLNHSLFALDDYSIISLREEDIFFIKEWRNQQMDVLRQNKVLTDEDQKNYYEKIVKPTFSQSEPKQVLFSYLKNEVCIGYGGLTNIDWSAKRIELSFLLDTSRISNNSLYEIEFTIFIKLIKKVVFEELKFNRIFTETYDIRPFHIGILEKNGFVLEGRMRQHTFINNAYVDSLIHGYIKQQYESKQ